MAHCIQRLLCSPASPSDVLIFKRNNGVFPRLMAGNGVKRERKGCFEEFQNTWIYGGSIKLAVSAMSKDT